jgi:hypothetical protein
MSYDLMVFEPGTAPSSRPEFMAWYKQQTKWTEPHGYNDPGVTTIRLRAWYDDMNGEYPNMNGPDVIDFDSPKLTDYSIGRCVIYVAFGWPEAENAYRTVRRFAEKHGVGFFDVSADEGEIWEPPAGGISMRGLWRRVFGR